MNFSDLISETFHSLTSNKGRSGLTILGIVIGIASVIAMVGIGEGSKVAIETSIKAAGSNLLTISPSAAGQAGAGARSFGMNVESLTREDAEELSALPLISGAAPSSSGQAQFVAGTANANATVYGVTPAYAVVKGLTVTSGSFISDRDDEKNAQVAVLGVTLAEDLFGAGVDPVGSKIRSGNMLLTVIGVLDEKGASGLTNVDSSVLIPLPTCQRYVTGSEYLSTVTLTVTDEERMDEAEAGVEALLLQQHGMADPDLADFQIQNMSDMLSTIESVTGTFTTLLAGIASISLLVGGIGIMNMMLTTVTERTREIGLRKAIGASSGAISAQFLTESVVLTLLGGALGILTGWGIGALAAGLLGISAVITLDAVLLAATVCTAIGIAFGYYPARRAASLSPIEALRYQ